ncbi:VgrG-related protein [Micromonospora sp. U56]|uniref:VgrG-related protein n=1 Tax=Micromonospora sp. U56 TaxID=2824900 RepID=UPI001B3653ED|nr:VgrG-related protein [Micromonospora sp. U56]MBQ0895533.1 VgrG-related protein [Micromonospora sp. U56]
MSEGNYTSYLVVKAPRELPPAWDTRLVHASIEDSTNLPASATLRYRDQKSRMLQELGITIGTKLTAAARTGDQPAPVQLFTGEVVTVETEFDGTGTFTTIRALDLSHRLMRGRRVASYFNSKASDIAAQLARKAGLRVGRIDPTTTVYEMVTQPNMTDWEFLRMLAVDNDAEVVMIDGTFAFRRPVRAATAPGAGTPARQSPYVVQMNENLLAVRSTVTSIGQLSRVTVRGWDVQQRKELRGQAVTATSDELQLSVTPRDVVRPFGEAELLVTDVPYRTDAEVKAVATALASDVTSAFAELEVGIRGNPRLRAGTPLTLQDVGAPFAGKYTTTASRHVFGPASFYETWLTVSGRQDRSSYGLAAGASAAARVTRVPGLAIGIVTDTKAGLDRRHPERRDQGWVKLRFPWLSDQYVTDWVRTVQLGGVGGGGVISPEVGDEVLVGFEQGLLDRPYVIGGLYNGVDKPSPHDLPLVNPADGSVNRRSLASREGGSRGRRSRRGNWVELLDGSTAQAAQGIRLTTQSGADKLVVHLDRAGTSVVVRSDGSVVIEAKREVVVNGQGITLDAGRGPLTLTGRSVSVSGTADVDIKAPIVRIN